MVPSPPSRASWAAGSFHVRGCRTLTPAPRCRCRAARIVELSAIRLACWSAQPRTSVRRPTHTVITQPTPPMTARNSSPPTHDAAATPPNRSGEDQGDRPARPIRSMIGRGVRSGRGPTSGCPSVSGPAGPDASPRSLGSSLRALQVERHEVAGDRGRDLAAAAGLLDEDRDRDRRRPRPGRSR